jgi:hypothetical protein
MTDNPCLPDAVVKNPSCGVCGDETHFDGDVFTCDDCQLAFNCDDLNASFLDSDAEPCGKSCDNSWHGDNRIKAGVRYDCGTCQLPSGHESLCWTGCRPRAVVSRG